MNKNMLLILAAGLLGVSAYWISYSPATPGDTEHSNPLTNTSDAPVSLATVNKTPALNAKSAIPVQPTTQSAAVVVDSHVLTRLQQIKERRPELSLSGEQLAQLIAKPNAWAPTDEPAKNLPLESAEFTDGREFIQMDTLKLETLMPGDQLEIPLQQQGKTYKVAIDEVVKQTSDTISWYGHIDADDGQSYSVSISRGKQLTVGGIDTPEGHFVLQAHGKDGWIASSDTLFKVNPEVSDEVYPEDVAQH